MSHDAPAESGSPDSGDDRPRLSTGRKLAFLGVWLVVLAGFAELALRRLMVDTEIRLANKRGGLIQPYWPGSSADLVSRDFRVRYEINERGFRDQRGRDPSRRSRPVRALLLGDSFTEGYGVKAEETYGARLAELEPRIEVWNRARMGNSPLYYVLQMREFRPALKPELVIVQLFDNDPAENRFRHVKETAEGQVGALPEELRPGALDGWRRLALVRAARRLKDRLSGEPPARLFVRPGAWIDPATLVVSDERAAAGDAGFSWYDPAHRGEWTEAFARQERYLRQLITEFRAGGPGRLLIVYIPHVGVFRRGDTAAARRAANPHARLIAKVCGELDQEWIDTTELLADSAVPIERCYFPHDLHWTPAGHRVFAEALAKRLAPWVDKVREGS